MKKTAAQAEEGPPKVRKICIVSHDTPSIVPFRGHLLQTLVANGHFVEVLAPNASTENIKEIQKLGVSCISYALDRTGMSPLRDLRLTHYFYQFFTKSQPDIAIFYAAKPCVFGPIAARAAGVRKRIASTEGLGVAFTNDRSVISFARRLLRTTVATLYKASLHSATRVLFLNENDREDFVRWKLVTRGKTRIVGAIGVDLSEYAYSAPPTQSLVFLFVGRLLREKGICEFVEAARIVRRIYPKARFVVLGALDKSPASIAQEMLNGWTDAGLIEYYGQVNVRPWLMEASVFVLPSYREGVPRSTQEAMAVGRAVVTTDVPGCRHTVVNGVNGFLCEPYDAHDLAKTLCRFTENSDLVLEMSRASRRIAEERFDVRQCTQRIIEAYELEET